MTDAVEEVWRTEAPHVLAALLRKYPDLEACEDAAQEAFAAALEQWPRDGVPDQPRGWLIRVASRRAIDAYRSESSRAEREEYAVRRDATGQGEREVADRASEYDDTLQLLFLCTHPSLARDAQLALTLRAVGGLTTRQIAAAFFLPEATVGQRISRAKRTLRQSGARFDASLDPQTLSVVRQVLYLIFNEGYATSDGSDLQRVSLAREAIRLTRQLSAARPRDSESAGLLALMLLTDARSPARASADGQIVRLQHQRRDLWKPEPIAEGVAILERALPAGPTGPYQVQAAIAAIHDESSSWSETDWTQIVILYRMLQTIAPSPMVIIGLAAAIGMTEGPESALALLEPLRDDTAVPQHRLCAARAHLLEELGRTAEAAAEYRHATALTRSKPEQRYLNSRLAAIESIDDSK